MPFYLNSKLYISLLLTSLFWGCQTKTPTCILTFGEVKQNNMQKILIDTSGSNNEIEDKTFAKENVGGYYSFNKSGLIKSYSFFTETDSTYDKTNPDEQLIEEDTTSNNFSFCSYSEQYDEKGQIKKVFGNPLVYKVSELIKEDTLTVSLYFFSLNKVYEPVTVQTNSNDKFKLTLIDDSLFTNMKMTSFSYNFKKRRDIKIYIETNFRNSCSNHLENLRDTISLNYEAPPKKKNGM